MVQAALRLTEGACFSEIEQRMPRRYFTLEEAGALLPRLSAILRRSVQLHQLLRARAERLAEAGYEVSEALLAGEEPRRIPPGTTALLGEARGLYESIIDEAAQVRALGADLKGADLVDFWSWVDGQREVLLCWKLGEPEIAWFHTAEAGFAGRQPVAGHSFTKQQGS